MSKLKEVLIADPGAVAEYFNNTKSNRCFINLSKIINTMVKCEVSDYNIESRALTLKATCTDNKLRLQATVRHVNGCYGRIVTVDKIDKKVPLDSKTETWLDLKSDSLLQLGSQEAKDCILDFTCPASGVGSEVVRLNYIPKPVGFLKDN